MLNEVMTKGDFILALITMFVTFWVCDKISGWKRKRGDIEK